VKAQTEAGGYQLSTQLKALAQDKVSQAVQEMVTEFGGRTTSPVRTSLLAWPGINTVEPEPIAVLEAARELERAACALTIGHIRAAREAGRNWHEIGDALDLLPAAAANKISTAEEAYDYAFRDRVSVTQRTFTWTCPACHSTTIEHGPWPDVPGREEGHEPDCPRRTAEIAAWEERSLRRE
jgi:hypothetical protein